LVSMVLAAVLAITLYRPLMAGQLSVASPGFYALGGYIAAILSTKVFHPGPGLYPVSLVVLEMAVAAVVSGVLGLVVGVPARRRRGTFLALATIAFVRSLGVVALNLEVTGGAIGIFGIPQPFSSQLQYMWLAIPLLLLSMLFVARLERTRTGRALIALREDELAAAALAVHPTYHKVLPFTHIALPAGTARRVPARLRRLGGRRGPRAAWASRPRRRATARPCSWWTPRRAASAASSPSMRSRSRWRAASCSGSSGPTEPARPRCSISSRA